MIHKVLTVLILALLTVSTAHGEGLDSLQLMAQRGDSCMEGAYCL